MTKEYIEIYGAKAHNLKDINLKIPRNSLVTITGKSGSGKSSLAFDTIYAEGQRRYLETFSAYIRNYLGSMERPQVDKITGLSPVIAIEQKSTNKNPRSTVGTVTEIYDLLRLLYARVAEAYSVNTGEKMVKYTEEQIIELIKQKFSNKKINILAPMVKGRKGHYRELFQQVASKGYAKVRVDGEIRSISIGMKLDRYKIHDIEVVIDSLEIEEGSFQRLKRSVATAFKVANNNIMILDEECKEAKYYSKNLMCPTTGISYPDAEPNSFSFNSPYGACPKCNGLGEITEVDIDKLIPNKDISISKGGIVAINMSDKDSFFYKKIASICKKYNVSLTTKIKDMPEECLNEILYGTERKTNEELMEVEEEFWLNYLHFIDNDNFAGIVNIIKKQINSTAPASIIKWANSFVTQKVCPECEGKRLRKESLAYRILDKNIADLVNMDLRELEVWIKDLPSKLTEKQLKIGKEIIREIDTKINFLIDVGLGYLHLNQKTASLSGGEAQRIRLATQIGSELVNVLYILDEPSIGLHQSDNIKLINSLKQLRDKGNSVIVVEHDKEMMLASDWIIDIGEDAGVNGGRVIAEGKPSEFLKEGKEKKNTKQRKLGLTAEYLNGIRKIEVPKQRRKLSEK
ncbi:MAG: excinuclease ABC subunit UvrA, partial [Bacteroidota bacterium]|nr:excinuclease ABC subunit UvrA [Bacteroidota bacterium]